MSYESRYNGQIPPSDEEDKEEEEEEQERERVFRQSYKKKRERSPSPILSRPRSRTNKQRQRSPLIPYKDGLFSYSCPTGCGFYLKLTDTLIVDDQGIGMMFKMSSLITREDKDQDGYNMMITHGHSPAPRGTRKTYQVFKCVNHNACNKTFRIDTEPNGKAVTFKYTVL